MINSEKYAPWMTSELTDDSKRARALYRKYQRRQDINNLETYRHA